MLVETIYQAFLGTLNGSNNQHVVRRLNYFVMLSLAI